jgi:hypothetical protein
MFVSEKLEVARTGRSFSRRTPANASLAMEHTPPDDNRLDVQHTSPCFLPNGTLGEKNNEVQTSSPNRLIDTKY